MRKILALALVLGVTVMVGGFATATGGDALKAPATTPSGIKYDWMGAYGELAIVGEPGTQYAVYDSAGTAVAGGELEAEFVSFGAGNSGVGPDGVIVFVVVGEDIVAVTDPDWNWD